MKERPLRITILGTTITSSWGNRHAATYRGLVRELVRRGHDVAFLERDVPWYAEHRDLPNPPWGDTYLYGNLAGLELHAARVRESDLVIVGSFVPEGIAVGDWVLRTARGVTAFYDLDTPVTLQLLEQSRCEHLATSQLPRYALYLSITGGPTLERVAADYGSACVRALYCAVDPEQFFPQRAAIRECPWDLGHVGTYSEDRQPRLERLLIQPARYWPGGRFAVAGAQYPPHVRWSGNIDRLEQLAQQHQRAFYNGQRFTLSLGRAAMMAAGHSPSARLFESAACGTPIICDAWEGLDSVLRVGSEVLVARHARDVVEFLVDLPETQREALGERARSRVLAEHTVAHRALELERHARGLLALEPAA